ncbi:hypothetical protein BBO99_00008628 [Phytophthora kernoviae]|uniref:Major facilitator superfamily (MFS) profile domain-containing protein n=2 Tax=Phytophthora kernoviae TaxID=325452 RepID=A0A3R7J371_9STRA|nr:hypothetical protein G195_010007 [Phytophthora kernoviae 00238/432]KAG2510873.1 hypothetical protein JM16_008362 [Phytophthora kernoviae]KAG2514176.1 hypothetical protein JM18_008373 [Phytophthora kernoviae]RLN21099.1 hypothetical protein BBI17_008632 [Phytophthora kernoviae]RLN74959.1 hypothetical protein BBO99_00008628 [Phytophthora kernoviae]
MHIARIVQCFGVGNSSFSLPLFGAKVAPKELQGMFSGFMQMICVIGLFLANVVNIIIENRNRGWHTTNSVSMAPSLVVFQQATGINPIMNYSALIFKDITEAGIYLSLLMCRQMLLIGAVGMIIEHLFTAILFTIIRDGNVDNAGCPKIFPLKVRASAVALSKAANWAMGAVMTEVVKLFPSLSINGMLFLFAGLCLICLAFVYFFYPETKGIQLEGIEMLFHKGKNASSLDFVEVKSPISLA